MCLTGSFPVSTYCFNFGVVRHPRGLDEIEHWSSGLKKKFSWLDESARKKMTKRGSEENVALRHPSPRGHFLHWRWGNGISTVWSVCCLICWGNGGRERIDFVEAKGKFELFDGFEAFLITLDLLRWWLYGVVWWRSHDHWQASRWSVTIDSRGSLMNGKVSVGCWIEKETWIQLARRMDQESCEHYGFVRLWWATTDCCF